MKLYQYQYHNTTFQLSKNAHKFISHSTSELKEKIFKFIVDNIKNEKSIRRPKYSRLKGENKDYVRYKIRCKGSDIRIIREKNNIGNGTPIFLDIKQRENAYKK